LEGLWGFRACGQMGEGGGSNLGQGPSGGKHGINVSPQQVEQWGRRDVGGSRNRQTLEHWGNLGVKRTTTGSQSSLRGSKTRSQEIQVSYRHEGGKQRFQQKKVQVGQSNTSRGHGSERYVDVLPRLRRRVSSRSASPKDENPIRLLLQGEVLPLQRYPLRLDPVPLGLHEARQGATQEMEGSGFNSGRLHRRHLVWGDVSGGSDQNQGLNYHPRLRSFRLGAEQEKEQSDTVTENSVLGSGDKLTRHGLRNSWGQEEVFTEGRAGSQEHSTHLSEDVSSAGRKIDGSVSGIPTGEIALQGDVLPDRQEVGPNVGVENLSNKSTLGGSSGDNVVPQGPPSGTDRPNCINSDGNSYVRCFRLRLGRLHNEGRSNEGGNRILGLLREREVVNVEGIDRDSQDTSSSRTLVEEWQGDLEGRLVSRKRRLEQLGQFQERFDANNQGDLEVESQQQCDLGTSVLDIQGPQPEGRFSLQVGDTRRMGDTGLGFEMGGTELDNSRSGQVRLQQQSQVQKVQQRCLGPQLRRSRRLHSGLDRISQLGSVSISSRRKGPRAYKRARSDSSDGDSGVGGPTMVASAKEATLRQDGDRISRSGFLGLSPGGSGDFHEQGMEFLDSSPGWSQLSQATLEVLESALQPSTKAVYDRAWSKWCLFAELFPKETEELTQQVLLNFGTWLNQCHWGGYWTPCLTRLKELWERQGRVWPTSIQLKRMGKTLSNSRPRYKKSDPVEVWMIEKYRVLGPGSKDHPGVWLRDMAMVTLGMRLMLRPGELTKLTWEQVVWSGDTLVINLVDTKTNKAEPEVFRLWPTWGKLCPVRWLVLWSMCTITRGYNYVAMMKNMASSIFTEVLEEEDGSASWPRKEIQQNWLNLLYSLPRDRLMAFMELWQREESQVFAGFSRQLKSGVVSKALGRVAVRVGAEGHFTGKSLRIGGATVAAREGVPLAVIRAVARWKQQSTAFLYIRRTCGTSTETSARMGLH